MVAEKGQWSDFLCAPKKVGPFGRLTIALEDVVVEGLGAALGIHGIQEVHEGVAHLAPRASGPVLSAILRLRFW